MGDLTIVRATEASLLDRLTLRAEPDQDAAPAHDERDDDADQVIISVEDHSTEMIADWTRLTTQPRFPNVGPERRDPLARGWWVRPPVRHG